MNIYEVLRGPRITEKNTALAAQNKYTFNVAMDANKIEIRQAVERMFNVHVVKVNTVTTHGETKRVGRYGRNKIRTSDHKKAIVTVQEGQKIAFFEAQ